VLVEGQSITVMCVCCEGDDGFT